MASGAWLSLGNEPGVDEREQVINDQSNLGLMSALLVSENVYMCMYLHEYIDACSNKDQSLLGLMSALLVSEKISLCTYQLNTRVNKR